MFTVKTDTQLIKVKFCHFSKGEDKNRRFYTKCNLKVIDLETEEEITKVETFSIYNPSDKLFGKNIGKKFALAKAINSVKEKSVRTLIWETFFQIFGLEKPIEFIKGYSSGFTRGYSSGYNRGYSGGFNRGLEEF